MDKPCNNKVELEIIRKKIYLEPINFISTRIELIK